jgi:hypothetical protein
MSLKQILSLCLFVAVIPAALVAQQQDAVEAEVVIAQSVEDRQPVGGGTSFPEDVGQLTAWTRVTGAANTTIEHVWRYREHERVIPLNIGGSPWRTWSTKNIPAEWDGEWTFEVRDADGQVIATTTFTIGGSQ